MHAEQHSEGELVEQRNDKGREVEPRQFLGVLRLSTEKGGNRKLEEPDSKHRHSENQDKPGSYEPGCVARVSRNVERRRRGRSQGEQPDADDEDGADGGKGAPASAPKLTGHHDSGREVRDQHQAVEQERVRPCPAKARIVLVPFVDHVTSRRTVRHVASFGSLPEGGQALSGISTGIVLAAHARPGRSRTRGGATPRSSQCSNDPPPAAGLGAQTTPELCVGEQARNRSRSCGRIARWDHVTRGPMLHELPDPSDIRGDHRQSARHGLQDRSG